LGQQPLGAILHSSNEPAELLQWLCHDDSTINIVLELLLLYDFYNIKSEITTTVAGSMRQKCAAYQDFQAE